MAKLSRYIVNYKDKEGNYKSIDVTAFNITDAEREAKVRRNGNIVIILSVWRVR